MPWIPTAPILWISSFDVHVTNEIMSQTYEALSYWKVSPNVCPVKSQNYQCLSVFGEILPPQQAYCWLNPQALALGWCCFTHVKPCWIKALSLGGKNGKTTFFLSPQSDPVVSLLFTDQPRHRGLLSHPVQLVHAGESAAGRQRPQPAACGPTRPAERPLLAGKTHTHTHTHTHTQSFSWAIKQ